MTDCTHNLPHGRFIVVELEPSAPAIRWNTYTRHIADWPGVIAVSDLAYCSQEWLEMALARPADARKIEPPVVEEPEQGELFG